MSVSRIYWDNRAYAYLDRPIWLPDGQLIGHRRVTFGVSQVSPTQTVEAHSFCPTWLLLFVGVPVLFRLRTGPQVPRFSSLSFRRLNKKGKAWAGSKSWCLSSLPCTTQQSLHGRDVHDLPVKLAWETTPVLRERLLHIR